MISRDDTLLEDLAAVRERQDPIEQREAFQALVLRFYAERGRDYPWRRTRDPWAILVSEVMLQQTQTDRVVPKYEAFLDRFPVPEALADSSVEELLSLWKGLGYNRRALALKRAAEAIVRDDDGIVPRGEDALRALSGVGPYTAAAVRAFAFGEPVVLIETNIRRLYLYVFFTGRTEVPDREIMPLIAETLDRSDPRRWYYALMDLGAGLAKAVPNPSRRSRHYTKQSRFEGSDRQIRGRILDELLKGPRTRLELLELPFEDSRIDAQLRALVDEGFCEERSGRYLLKR